MTFDACWQWLIQGLGPRPYLVLFLVAFLTLICAIIVALLHWIFVGVPPAPPRLPLGNWIFYVAIAPLVEELLSHLVLMGGVMTSYWYCGAPQTALICGVAFALVHLPGGLVRLVDGIAIGFFNGVACLVYVRLFASPMGLSSWRTCLVSYGALVLAHAVYNFLTQLFKNSGLLAVGLRVGGLLFAIAAWLTWMPRLR